MRSILMIPIFFIFLAIVLLILTAVKIDSQKASNYFRHTSSKAPGETTNPLNFIKMEATNNKNQKRVETRVDNRVCFSNGEIRRPEYAILLPNECSVLCRAGKKLGSTAIISRREADRKGVSYLCPMQWEHTDYFVYPNNEVRDAKGKFVGTYLGHDFDDYRDPFVPVSQYGGMMHDIYILTKKGTYGVCCFGGTEKVDPISVVTGRLDCGVYYYLAEKGEGKDDHERAENFIRSLAELPASALHAALQLQELRAALRKVKPDDEEE